jgi:hypothetical protein
MKSTQKPHSYALHPIAVQIKKLTSSAVGDKRKYIQSTRLMVRFQELIKRELIVQMHKAYYKNAVG